MIQFVFSREPTLICHTTNSLLATKLVEQLNYCTWFCDKYKFHIAIPAICPHFSLGDVEIHVSTHRSEDTIDTEDLYAMRLVSHGYKSGWHRHQ